MSRSYRKPCYEDNVRGAKKAKIQAHRALRRNNLDMEIGQHCNYKKYFCRWDIHDQKGIFWLQYKHINWIRYHFTEEEYVDYVNKLKRK